MRSGIFVRVGDRCLACSVIGSQVRASSALITLRVSSVVTNIDFEVLQALGLLRVVIMLVA